MLCYQQFIVSFKSSKSFPRKFNWSVRRLRFGNDNSDYAFLDCGDFGRLEKFGDVLISRSCPAASWKRGLTNMQWNAAQLKYSGISGKAGEWTSSSRNSSLKDWVISINSLHFILQESSLGQVGIFPEQADNWNWIQKVIEENEKLKVDKKVVRILNGFAYTGGSTLACLSTSPKIDIVHLDASKSAVQWASRNVALMKSQELNNIISIANSSSNGNNSQNNSISYNSVQLPNPASSVRFIIDDCLTFLEREIRRGSKYDAFIFDPPAFGRGANNKIWKLEKDLPILVSMMTELLSDEPLFVLLSCHDTDWPPDRLVELLRQQLPFRSGNFDSGPMILHGARVIDDQDKGSIVSQGKSLPCGGYVRWTPSRKKKMSLDRKKILVDR